MGRNFNGLDRRIDLPNSVYLSLGSGLYTAVLMFRSSDACAALNTLWNNYNADGSAVFAINLRTVDAAHGVPAGSVQVALRSSTGNQMFVSTQTAYNDGQWHVVIVVRTSTTSVVIYVDDTTPSVFNDSTGTLGNIDVSAGRTPVIGALNAGGGSFSNHFNGDIGYVRMFKGVAFDQSMAYGAYYQTLSQRYRLDALAAEWRLLPNAVDTGPHGLHGTLVNAPTFCEVPLKLF